MPEHLATDLREEIGEEAWATLLSVNEIDGLFARAMRCILRGNQMASCSQENHQTTGLPGLFLASHKTSGCKKTAMRLLLLGNAQHAVAQMIIRIGLGAFFVNILRVRVLFLRRMVENTRWKRVQSVEKILSFMTLECAWRAGWNMKAVNARYVVNRLGS